MQNLNQWMNIGKYEHELKSKMEVIKSKINGDYDYNEDLKIPRSTNRGTI